MTLLIYAVTRKQIEDDHEYLKVVTIADAAEAWIAENDPEGTA